jgi:hypothetical protein
MKKFFAMCTIALILSSCENSKWEYKIVKIAGFEGIHGEFSAMSFTDPTDRLNSLGEEGWEVISSYTEESTVHPNFGNAEYVTGLQPNTRTTVVNFVLKRKK